MSGEYLDSDVLAICVRLAWSAGNGGVVKSDLDIEYRALPFHSSNNNPVGTELRRKTGIEIEDVLTETESGETMSEDLKESTVACQERESRVDAAVDCVDVIRLFRELIEWKTKLLLEDP